VDQQELLDLIQALFHLVPADHGLAHFDEGADDEDAHLNSSFAVQNRGGHDGPVFGESEREMLDVLALL
jgi:hypothetical protein